ncbi:hypothetical protein NDU88_003871 [Pleurodeles waltl]|uniref:Uncharacterized protein n=1 Tax=Pleurodeles waltl TaxID=8319 RepID=A0AAV7MRU7_PLEWA|nr:hypothetical protein NDU88_003871 [Pleurodeles waltl]
MTADEVNEEHVRALACSSCPRALDLKEISGAATDDAVLMKVRNELDGSWQDFLINANDWTTTEKDKLPKFWRIHNELSATQDGLILRGHELVILLSLQQRAAMLVYGG